MASSRVHNHAKTPSPSTSTQPRLGDKDIRAPITRSSTKRASADELNVPAAVVGKGNKRQALQDRTNAIQGSGDSQARKKANQPSQPGSADRKKAKAATSQAKARAAAQRRTVSAAANGVALSSTLTISARQQADDSAAAEEARTRRVGRRRGQPQTSQQPAHQQPTQASRRAATRRQVKDAATQHNTPAAARPSELLPDAGRDSDVPAPIPCAVQNNACNGLHVVEAGSSSLVQPSAVNSLSASINGLSQSAPELGCAPQSVSNASTSQHAIPTQSQAANLSLFSSSSSSHMTFAAPPAHAPLHGRSISIGAGLPHQPMASSFSQLYPAPGPSASLPLQHHGRADSEHGTEGCGSDLAGSLSTGGNSAVQASVAAMSSLQRRAERVLHISSVQPRRGVAATGLVGDAPSSGAPQEGAAPAVAASSLPQGPEAMETSSARGNGLSVLSPSLLARDEVLEESQQGGSQEGGMASINSRHPLLPPAPLAAARDGDRLLGPASAAVAAALSGGSAGGDAVVVALPAAPAAGNLPSAAPAPSEGQLGPAPAGFAHVAAAAAAASASGADAAAAAAPMGPVDAAPAPMGSREAPAAAPGAAAMRSRPSTPAGAAAAAAAAGVICRPLGSAGTAAVRQAAPPPPYINIDSNFSDPQQCALYAPDIYSHLRANELLYRPAVRFMESVQGDINSNMRAILVDWLVEVAEEYRLVPDTLYLTCAYIDRYLSVRPVTRNRLQLLGVACMLIASKYEEIYAPQVEEFCYITDYTYRREEVLDMERAVLNELSFELTTATTKSFLRRFVKAAQVTLMAPSLQLEFLGNYLAELTLVDYNCLHFLPSLIAASAVFLAKLTLFPDQQPWNATLRHYTGYEPRDLRACVLALHELQRNAQTNSLPAIREKYRQERFQGVSSLAPVAQIQEAHFASLGE